MSCYFKSLTKGFKDTFLVVKPKVYVKKPGQMGGNLNKNLERGENDLA